MSHILVVDDEEQVRNVCYELFTREGYSVTTVPSGQDVFKVLKREQIDLILMDVQVPGEEGLSLLKTMPNQECNRIPVVVYSGFVDSQIEQEAIGLGAIDVIGKQSGLEELKNRVKKIFENNKRVSAILNDETLSDPIKKVITDEKEKIMLVDDEQSIRDFLREFFESKGFTIAEAGSGEEAIEKMPVEKPHMILLDVTMPGMDGITTLKEIRKINPAVGVVMATGISDEAIAREASKNGAYAYVTKPFDLKYLEMVVLTRLLLSV